MNYKYIIDICLLLFSFYLNCSYSYDIFLGKNYHILVDKKLSGLINANCKSYHEAVTNKDKSLCSYKLTFFQNKSANVNNSDTIHNKDQDTHDNITKYQKEQSTLANNLIYTNTLPLEWDFFNCFQSINNDSENSNDLTIDIVFHSSTIQKVIIFKISELSFNFYLSNSRINFLLFSNIRNVNFISMNQLKFNDQEIYENTSTISKVTILNIASVSNNNKFSNSDNLETSNDESYNDSTITRSSKIISMSEDKTERINRDIAQKKLNLHKNKTMNPTPGSRQDQDMLSILNNYCKTNIDQNYFVLLSGEFITFLKTSLKNIDKVNKNNSEIMLINPFSPSFIFNSCQIPQIKMFNVYILYLNIETLEDNKGFIFHFYPKENFLYLDLCKIKNISEFDFLTIYVNGCNYIHNITINENNHSVEYIHVADENARFQG